MRLLICVKFPLLANRFLHALHSLLQIVLSPVLRAVVVEPFALAWGFRPSVWSAAAWGLSIKSKSTALFRPLAWPVEPPRL